MNALMRNVVVFAAGLGAGALVMAQTGASGSRDQAGAATDESPQVLAAAEPATEADVERASSIARIEPDALAQIMARLDAEHDARTQLQAQITRLERELNALRSEMHASTELPADAMPTSDAIPGQVTGAFTQANSPEQLLAELGVSPAVAQDIKRRTDKLDMDRLTLRDRAAREGWLGEQKYFEELARVEGNVQTLRTELGDDTYDKFLYSMGQTNRVRVESVIEGSPAAAASVNANDTILAYADKRIFSPDDLRQATTEGVAGEMVPVTVWREGTAMELLVPRGPLGVKLDVMRERPQ